ncbi:MAG: hypothetical protein MUF56_00645 [Solirubrobacteraceae bacterium]|jgi:hypothetical protein|nr:hypothetical protein [Solirubrobacteraceae bacterium]
MRSRGAGAVVVAVVAALVAPAVAAGARAPVTITPKAPAGTDPITVTWTAKRAFKPGVVEVRADTGGYSPTCSGKVVATVRRAVRRGTKVRVTLRPKPRWCENEPLTVSVADTLRNRTIAGGYRVTLKGWQGSPVSVRTVAASTLTVQSPGRPDRSAPVDGVLRGTVPGLVKLGTDIELTLRSGRLGLGALPAEPLCAPPLQATELPLAAGRTGRLILLQSGEGRLTLPLDVAPASLTGCAAAPGAPSGAGPATLELSGKVGEGGLSRLVVGGSLPGVAVTGVGSAAVNVSLTLDVDLSGNA